MRKNKILIIDDNQDTRAYLTTILEKKFNILIAKDAITGINYAQNQAPDLIILDIMLPRLNGLDACQILKEDRKTKEIPIIILSVKSSTADITRGLTQGADDYIIKPFDTKELLARIEARIRIKNKDSQQVIIGDLEINPTERTVQFKNTSFKLTLTELDILHCLAQRVGEIVERKDIIAFVEEKGKKVINYRTIDVHIRSIRKKIPEISRHLSSVYGVGYSYNI